MGADAFADRHRGAGRRRRAGLRLADTAERKRAERGQAAGNKTRTAQEGAAVKAAFGLSGGWRLGPKCPRRDPIMPFRSPYEHRRCYFPG